MQPVSGVQMGRQNERVVGAFMKEIHVGDSVAGSGLPHQRV